MRFEATLPDTRGEALVELAKTLGISRSQLMDEALSLLLTAVVEHQKGRRVVVVDPRDDSARDLVIPSLAHMEWMQHRQNLTLPSQALEKIARLIAQPSPPTEALKKIMKGRKAGRGR